MTEDHRSALNAIATRTLCILAVPQLCRTKPAGYVDALAAVNAVRR